jgi:hypothetical protein
MGSLYDDRRLVLEQQDESFAEKLTLDGCTYPEGRRAFGANRVHPDDGTGKTPRGNGQLRCGV